MMYDPEHSKWLAHTPHFSIPPAETVIWRYLALDKFLDILVNGRIVLPRLDTFEDGQEGEIPSFTKGCMDRILDNPIVPKIFNPYTRDWRDLGKLARRQLYVSCWCESQTELDTHWRRYGDKSGIALRSTVGKVLDELGLSISTHGRVSYIDPASQGITLGQIQYIAMWKRQPYVGDREIRFVHLHDVFIPETCPAWKSFEFGIERCIDAVVVSPNAGSWLCSTLTNLVRKLGCSVKIQQSQLSSST